MGIKIQQDYSNIEESLLGGLKESLVKKGQQEIEAAFNELLKKPIKINGKNVKVDVTGLSEAVYKQLVDSFSNGKAFSPKVWGFDLSNIIKLDEKALSKKMAELSKFIQNASMDVSEQELSTKGRHFVSSYLVAKNKGFDVSKYDKFYNNIISETEAQEQAVKKIEEQLLAYSISNSSTLEELSNKLSEKFGKKNKARNIEILGKIYDADSQLDEISSEMDKLISEMKNIVFHAGNLDKKTLKSKNYSPADSLKFALQRGRFDSQGSGTFFTSNLIDVLDWYNTKSNDGEKRRIYADDLSKYSQNMFKLSSDEMSQDYSAFLERLSNFVMLVATSDDKYKKKLQDEGVTSVKELYLAGEDYFTNFKITVDQLNEWIEDEAKYIKSFSNIDEMGKSHSINTRFQQKFLGTNGIDATRAVLDDSVARGSIVFEIDKNNPYTIDFGSNTDIAEMFYEKIMERIMDSKAKYALTEDDVRDIVDNYIPDNLKGSAIHEQLEEKMVADYQKTGTHYVDDYETLNRFADSDNGELDSKTTEQILEQNDALDENIQKQKQLVAEKERETEVQKELNNATKEQNDLLSNSDVPIERMEQYQNAIDDVVDTLADVEQTEEKISSKVDAPIIPEDSVEQIDKAEEEIDEFGQKIRGIKEFAQNYDLFDFKDFDEETLDKLQSTLFALNSEDLKKLGFENTDEILEDLALINERLAEVRWQFENNDFTDEGWVASDQLDDYFDSSTELTVGYNKVREVADSARMSIQNLINTISDYKDGQTSEVIDVDPTQLEYLDQEIEREQELISVENEKSQTIQEVEQVEDNNNISFLDQVRKAIDATKEETEAIENVGEVSNEVANTQVNDYERIKREIKETQEEIDRLNSQDIARSKIPKYVDDVYTAKTSKYSKMSDEEFNNKIIEKSQETVSTATKDFRVQMTSILAMIDEAKKRGQSLKFEDLISGSPDELKVAKDYFEKIVTYISALNDESFVDDIPQKLAKATQKLRDLNIELKNVAENSNDFNFFDYKLNEMIGELSSKRKGISQDEADRLIQLTDTLSRLSGKDISISDYTDNEKIIAGVTRRLENLRLEQERAAQSAREAALAEKQQAEANEQTTETIKDQTVAVVQNTEVQETNAVVKATGTTPLPNSIKAGFKDESGVVDAVVSSERTSLDELKNKIFEVRAAIESKTQAFNDELSTVERVVGDERTSLDLLRDKLAEIKGYVDELYKHIGNIGKIDFSGKIEVDGLTTLLSSLKDEKLNDKLTAMYVYLDDFAKAVNQIDFKNNLTQELNTILSKGEELKNLANILKSSNKKIKNAGKSQESKELKDYNKAYKDLISTEERYQQLKNKESSGELLTAKEASDLVKIENRRQRDYDIIAKTTDEIKKQSNAEKEYADYQKETTDAINAAAEAQKKLNDQRESNSLKNDLQKQIDSLSSLEFNSKFTDKYSDVISDKIKNALDVLANGTNEEIENTIGLLKQFKDSIPKNALESSYLALDKDLLDISELLSDNTKMSKRLKKELQDMYAEVSRYRNTGVFEDKDLIRIKDRIIEIKAELKNTKQEGDALGEKLKKQLSSLWQRDFARYFGLNDIIRYIRQISTEVTKLDTALTELRKVSDASSERLQQSLQKSTDTAKELGSTIEDVIKVTSDWARLGYNVDEAEELARVTTLFKNVGDNMSVEDASSFMISTLKGFEMEASQAMDIADKFNEVANNFAIDTAGIGDALQRSAAAFNAANTDLNESIALITATNAVVQDPESVGKHNYADLYSNV